MGAANNKASVAIKVHNIVNETTSHSSPPSPPQEIPLAASPSILLHLLSSYGLEPKDLAALEATCTFYRRRANFEPDATLSLPELAAYDTCCQKAMFKSMKHEEKESLKHRCGGSWKLVLAYLLIGEKNYHRGKPQVVAGPGHTIAVTAKGHVYSFGANSSGQLGLGNTEEQFQPCLIRSLQGIRITQAAVGSRRTMLVSDTGRVYAFGQDSFGGLGIAGPYTSSPTVVESLKDIFVVQASIGGHFSAVLSREGQVYTFCWGCGGGGGGGGGARLGHRSDPADLEPRLLPVPLDEDEDAHVVQIAAGNCYLLVLAYQPTGMSVYSLGCGLGGKLGHGGGTTTGLETPRKIEHFQALKVNPVSISAGAFHCAALASDGRVFTWGWDYCGCLGHGDADEQQQQRTHALLPTAVAGLGSVKARHVSAVHSATFVVADNGDVYSFGGNHSRHLGFDQAAADDGGVEVRIPKLAVTGIVSLNENVVQISATNTWDWPSQIYSNDWTYGSHTCVLTDSGRLYSLGRGSEGQLGVKLAEGQNTRADADLVAIDLA